jgi:DnaJ-class molecular chaperone
VADDDRPEEDSNDEEEAPVTNLMIPCPACGGKGSETKWDEKQKINWVVSCSFCFGSGRVNRKRP